jgi:hypothetical protein
VLLGDVLLPGEDEVVALDDPFSSTPVTRTRRFMNWLKLTLEPDGWRRYADAGGLPAVDPLTTLSAVLPEVLVPDV